MARQERGRLSEDQLNRWSHCQDRMIRELEYQKKKVREKIRDLLKKGDKRYHL